MESFIFETQDFMDGEEAKVISTEEQRTAIMEVLSAASEWLFDEGEVADTEVSIPARICIVNFML